MWAKTTPHIYVIDKEGQLIYNDATDNKLLTRVKDIKDAKNYVRDALDEAMDGKSISFKTSQPLSVLYSLGVRFSGTIVVHDTIDLLTDFTCYMNIRIGDIFKKKYANFFQI